MVALVVVLERLLSYLVALSDKAQAHPNEEQSYLEPAILVFLAVFVLPMIFRSAAIICTLIDGYYTQICTSGLASVVFEKALNLPAGSAPQEEPLRAEGVAVRQWGPIWSSGSSSVWGLWGVFCPLRRPDVTNFGPMSAKSWPMSAKCPPHRGGVHKDPHKPAPL